LAEPTTVEHCVQRGGLSAFARDESDLLERLAQKSSHMGLAIDDTGARRHFSLPERRQLGHFLWLLFGHNTPYDLTRGATLFSDHPKSEAFRKKPLRN
jgi:hypothetical protein